MRASTLRAALLSLALVFASALPAFAGFEEARAAYERGDYKTAHRELLKAAEQGDAIAQYNLGVMYRDGEGVPKDDAEAVLWFRKAAEQGDADAQFSLGWAYKNGEGVQKDDAEAVRWYRKAAEQGDAWAQNNLGVMYVNGRGVQKNNAEAARWFRKAAEQGNANAQFSLGWAYNNGEGVQKDDAEAVRWYRKAAEQGDAIAQYNLGVMYRDGEGVPKDDAEAARWFRKAAEQGDANAQNNLGVMYENGEGVQKDDAEAVRWYRKAAEQGDAWAQNNLGVMYVNGRGVQKNNAEAARWFRKAAEQGNANAQNSLGSMYVIGRGVQKNNAEAARWFRKAAEQGDARAQFIIGILYAEGQGVPKDDAEAARWLRQSAEQGNAEAQFNLGMLYDKNEGIPRDRIEAYMWLNLAAAQGNEKATKERDRIQRYMTQSQISQAQTRTRDWRPSSSSDAPGDGAARRSVTPREPAPRASSALPDSTGSGFFVSSAGHVLTNDHLIADCARLRVSPLGGNAVIKARDRRNDLALLQLLQGSTRRGARPALLRSGRARLGETAVVAGYPLRGLVGDGLNVTGGEVSALSGIGGDSRHLQVTAPVQPGNSGGPLLDGTGHVLGVVVSKLNAIRAAQLTGDIPQNVNFAIRAEVARAFLDAHNIPYQTARPSTARSTEQIAAEARAYTVLIECWE